MSVPHTEVLRYDEILKLVELFAELGIRKIKLTGGEPLVRRGLPGLVKELKQIPGIAQVTLTTNGVQLAEMMDALAEAGIDAVNLSLDTLNPQVFKQITRRDDFARVMEGYQAALRFPQIPLKINCVPMGIAGQNVLDLAELARESRVHVRYIEMMPIGLGKQFVCLKEDELLAELRSRYGECTAYEKMLGNGPGHYYEFTGFQGKIGFISAVSHKFCASCNRVRLTSQGYLKTCLQYDIGTDLKTPLRSGATAQELKELVAQAIQQKPQSHQFHADGGCGLYAQTVHAEHQMMSQIGG